MWILIGGAFGPSGLKQSAPPFATSKNSSSATSAISAAITSTNTARDISKKQTAGSCLNSKYIFKNIRNLPIGWRKNRKTPIFTLKTCAFGRLLKKTNFLCSNVRSKKIRRRSTPWRTMELTGTRRKERRSFILRSTIAIFTTSKKATDINSGRWRKPTDRASLPTDIRAVDLLSEIRPDHLETDVFPASFCKPVECSDVLKNFMNADRFREKWIRRYRKIPAGSRPSGQKNLVMRRFRP